MSVFDRVAVRRQASNRFNLSHDKKFSTDMGYLTPILCADVLPGDTWRISTDVLARFAPMVAPLMHRVNMELFYFFVPNRLVWDGWEDFISPPKAGSVPPVWPYFGLFNTNLVTQPKSGSVADYLGVPVDVTGFSGGVKVSAIPFAGYRLIYNEYFRDQNLIDEVDAKCLSGDNTGTPPSYSRVDAWVSSKPFLSSYRHDYFTANLPFAQKGAPVSIPITGSATDVPVALADGNADSQRWRFSGSHGLAGGAVTGGTSTSQGYVQVGGTQGYLDPGTTLVARTSQLTGLGTTVNDLRVSIRTQEFLERQAVGGSRYIEQIRMQFGVLSSDKRLNRPEFIGKTSGPVIFSEVLQTSESSATPQATMAGHGISAGKGRRFRYRAEEHGYIFCIARVMPDTAYMQGLPRHFSRSTLYDYAWPVLSHIGEQATLNKELYIAGDSLNESTFGYLPRYSEYRYIPSSVAGDFRNSLDFWHLSRKFANRPLLNKSFIEANPDNMMRIFAVTDTTKDTLYCHAHHNIVCSRVLPKYGTPTL